MLLSTQIFKFETISLPDIVSSKTSKKSVAKQPSGELADVDPAKVAVREKAVQGKRL